MIYIQQCISASVTPINKITTATPIFLVQEVNGAIPNTANVTRSLIFKMAAAKPEVLMSRLLEKIATPFQRLIPIFGVLIFNDAISNTVRCNRKSEIQDGGRCYLVQKLKYKYFQFGGLHLEIPTSG